MTNKRAHRCLVTILCISICAAMIRHPARARACGPFFATAVLTFRMHPDSLDKYARGQIGIILPSYARSYLAVAYRYLSGVDLDAREQAAVRALWDERLNSKADEGLAMGIKRWSEQRARVAAASPPQSLDSAQMLKQADKDGFSYFLNCGQDSFETAARTLAGRIGKFGVDSPEVKDWTASQDIVYSNCSQGSAIPPLAKSGYPQLIQADRAYQIAAANFYAGQFAVAERMFRDIAADSSSPWRQIAPYLAARTLIREATLGAGPGKVDTATLEKAESQLIRILADSNEREIHPAAARLMGFVRFRLHPRERLRELASAVYRPGSGATLKQDLTDYTLMMDQYDATTSSSTDDGTDWILAIQSTEKASADHSFEKWSSTRSLPWLVALMSKIEPADKRLPEILAAAAKVDAGSPAYAIVSYHRVRLLVASGDRRGARRALDHLFALGSPPFPPSSINMFLSLRMQVAESLDEFLKYAQRSPSAFTFDDREIPYGAGEITNLELKLRAGDVLDRDSAAILNYRTPLDVLIQAATSKELPRYLRADIALAAWVRAVILGDEASEKTLTPILQDLEPSLKAGLADCLSATSPEARRFAAVFLILNTPAARPYIMSGLGRTDSLDKVDEFRDNWWCAFSPAADLSQSNLQTIWASQDKEASSSETGSKAAAPSTPAAKLPELVFPDFFTGAEKTAALSQWKRLSALKTAPDFLPENVIAYAGKHPEDKRVPEALYLAVRSTRYGCPDKETVKLSKAAFEFLHKSYPNSDWAKKTKYWFGN